MTTQHEAAGGNVETAAASAPAIYEGAQAPAAVAGGDPFFSMIERAALDPAISVEKLERLFELSERARAVRAKQAFAEAFAALQPELPTITRNNRVVIYSKKDRDKPGGPVEGVDTPQQSTPYASLETIVETIRQPLAEHGFSIRFEHTSVNGLIGTSAILTHRDGHAERADIPPMQHDSTGSKNNNQALGSSLTYGRRYALLALLAIVSHAPQDADDDGRASGKPPGALTEAQIAEINALIDDTNSEPSGMLKYVGAASIEGMTPAQYAKAKAALLKKKQIVAAKASGEAA
jgi:hypothetical protein